MSPEHPLHPLAPLRGPWADRLDAVRRSQLKRAAARRDAELERNQRDGRAEVETGMAAPAESRLPVRGADVFALAAYVRDRLVIHSLASMPINLNAPAGAREWVR